MPSHSLLRSSSRDHARGLRYLQGVIPQWRRVCQVFLRGSPRSPRRISSWSLPILSRTNVPPSNLRMVMVLRWFSFPYLGSSIIYLLRGGLSGVWLLPRCCDWGCGEDFWARAPSVS